MDKVANQVMQEMILYFGKDARRINHALKVYALTKTIGELEGLSPEKLLTLEIAAILHDIGIKESERKYGSSAGHHQEIEGPPVARQILQGLGLNNLDADRICYLIGNHHSYNKIDDLDFQILVEADFLVNIFEDSMDANQVNPIKLKYFKTKTGLAYLQSMYCC